MWIGIDGQPIGSFGYGKKLSILSSNANTTVLQLWWAQLIRPVSSAVSISLWWQSIWKYPRWWWQRWQRKLSSLGSISAVGIETSNTLSSVLLQSYFVFPQMNISTYKWWPTLIYKQDYFQTAITQIKHKTNDIHLLFSIWQLSCGKLFSMIYLNRRKKKFRWNLTEQSTKTNWHKQENKIAKWEKLKKKKKLKHTIIIRINKYKQIINIDCHTFIVII